MTQISLRINASASCLLTLCSVLACGSGTADPGSAYDEPVLPPAPEPETVEVSLNWQDKLVTGAAIPTAGVDRPSYVHSTGFFVQGGRLYDKYGVDFIVRGLSNPHAWYDGGGQLATDALDDISGYGFNTVRIVWEADGGLSAKSMRRIFEHALDARMVPMLEIHDATGSRANDDLLKIADYLTSDEVRPLLQEFEEYVLINVANEWSGNDWRGAYTAVIDQLRAAGLNHTLVIDANGWGQNAQVLFDDGPALLEADPEHNLIFSTHMYEQYSFASTIEDTFGRAASEKLPFLVGEFGFEHNDKTIDVDVILEQATELGYGYVAWSWIGNSSDVAYLDMAKDWGGPLTDWGEWVVNGAGGVAETSVRASFFAED